MSKKLLDVLRKHLPANAFEKVQASARQVIELQLRPAPPEWPATASRVGGIGYWPQHLEYPVNSQGKPLALLAQFNLAELPAHPDLPDSGLLAFYIDPHSVSHGMDFDDPTQNADTRCVYFADTHAPGLSRQIQQQLLDVAGARDDFLGDEDDEDDEGEGDEEEFEDIFDVDEQDDAMNAREIDFMMRWLDEAKAMLREWLDTRSKAIARFGDESLSAIWKQEKQALPPLAQLADQIEFDKEDEPVCDWRRISHFLLRRYFAKTQARIASTALRDTPQARQWVLLDGDEDEETNEKSMQAFMAQQLMLSGDPRWLQYWRHDPRAVLEVDWQMQSDLIALYDDPALTAQWQQLLPQLRAQADAIVAQAERAMVTSAPELDILLEGQYTTEMIRALREHFNELPVPLQKQLHLKEMEIFTSRMERLAAHFAQLGFVAQGQAPQSAEQAFKNFAALMGDEIEQRLASAGSSQDLGHLLQDLFDQPEDEDERRQVAEVLERLIAENDAYIAQLNLPAVSGLWQAERAALQSKPPQSKTGVLMHFNMDSASTNALAKQGILNPVIQKYMAELAAFDEDFDFYAHPVEGEFAIGAQLATHYLLYDNLEFERHYGMPLHDWIESLDLKPQALARLQEKIPELSNHNHLLGTPNFTQTDPRPDDSAHVLLFQLASTFDDDDLNSVLWGDMGIGQFFIAREDLQNRRFEKAWLHWDCH